MSRSVLALVRQRLILSKEKTKTAISSLWESYEDLIGIREVRKTQESVLSAERNFVHASKERRDVNTQLSEVQNALKETRQKLDSTSRTDEAYLELVTREHKLFKEESRIVKELMQKENRERDLFSCFSQNLRDCQEVERMRQERTKYLSLLGSLIGAALGIIGTSINHALKNRDYKKILQAIESQTLQIQLQSERLDFNHEQRKQSEEKENTETLTEELEEPADEMSAVVDRIQKSEAVIVDKMNLNAILTISVTYLLIVFTLPLIRRICGD